MSEKFDPYRKWLGIPPSEQPPDHYRLLGIASFEDDLDVIAYAADRQMSHVRKFQSGPNGADAQKLLSELAMARRCLLAQEQRAAYDGQLREKAGTNGSKKSSPVAAPQPGRQKPVPAPVPPPAETPVQPKRSEPPPPPTSDVPKAQPIAAKTKSESSLAVRSLPVTPAGRRSRRKKNSAVPMIGALVALAGMACVILVVVIAVTSSETPDQSSANGNSMGVQNTSMQQPPGNLPKPPKEEDDRPRRRRRPKPPKDRDLVMPEEGIGGSETGEGDLEDNGLPALTVEEPEVQDGSQPDALPLPSPETSGNGADPGDLEFDPADVPDVPEGFPDPDASLPKPGDNEAADDEPADNEEADDEP